MDVSDVNEPKSFEIPLYASWFSSNCIHQLGEGTFSTVHQDIRFPIGEVSSHSETDCTHVTVRCWHHRTCSQEDGSRIILKLHEFLWKIVLLEQVDFGLCESFLEAIELVNLSCLFDCLVDLYLTTLLWHTDELSSFHILDSIQSAEEHLGRLLLFLCRRFGHTLDFGEVLRELFVQRVHIHLVTMGVVILSQLVEVDESVPRRHTRSLVFRSRQTRRRTVSGFGLHYFSLFLWYLRYQLLGQVIEALVSKHMSHSWREFL